MKINMQKNERKKEFTCSKSQPVMIRGLGKVSEALGTFRYPPYKVNRSADDCCFDQTDDDKQEPLEAPYMSKIPGQAEALSRVRWIIENRYIILTLTNLDVLFCLLPQYI